MSDDIYFASKPSDEAAAIIIDKAEAWYNSITRNGYLTRIKKSWAYYHGLHYDEGTHQISFAGEQGELLKVPVNHYRNIGMNMLTLTTANRPALDARGANSDYKTSAQVILANGLLDYYMREKRLERYITKATEYAIVLSEGYVKVEWDANKGREYGANPDTGAIIYEGDVRYQTLGPLDVIRDPFTESEDTEWIICRSYKNKFNLAAKFPEKAKEITAISLDKTAVFYMSWLESYMQVTTDLIPVLEFYHKPTEAVPEGRYILMTTDGTVLMDMPSPYRDIPVYRIVPSEVLGVPYGYTTMFDLIPIQETINLLYSIIATNQHNTGVTNILVPKGAGLILSQLFGGMNILEYDKDLGKPEVMNLTFTPGEIFSMLNKLENTMETISSINSVIRGNPEPNLRSGNSMALIAAQAIQFSSLLQQSYIRLLEDTGSALIKLLQDFATVPRIAAIVGRNNRTYLKETYDRTDLEHITRVIVDVGNPLAKTTAGRVEMADKMMQYGKITPEQYLTVVSTGRLDPMVEGGQKELLYIKLENELLGMGDPDSKVHAIYTDDHLLHIQEHKAVLADPDLRNDPVMVQVVLDHIDEHYNLLQNTDPGKLAATGQQAMPSMVPPTGAEGDGALAAPAPGGVEVPQITQPNLPSPPAPFDQMPVVAGDVPPGQ
jgi:hypothetical protein